MRAILVFFSAILTLASSAGVEEFAASSQLFSASVYDEILADNNDNILFSPFSVETVLALTQSGAVGVTGEEIRKALFLPSTKEDTEAEIRTVLPTIHSDKYTLQTANKVYVENNFPIEENFKTLAKDVYQAAFESIEFAENVQAAEEINAWVEENTNDKIHNIVSPGDLDATTRVILVNALYFQGNWTAPFDPSLTRKSTFHAPNDKIVEMETMNVASAEYNFYENIELDAKFLEVPFLGQEATMTFVLPNKIGGIQTLERQSRSVLSAPKYTKEHVRVALPKFKIEASIEFTEILQKLGVNVAFSEFADFSGIAGTPGDILLSKVTQKTFIDVNELGVEAAAATAIVGITSVPPPATEDFIADHPFLFYIKVHDIVLFEGRVLEPKYE